MGSGEKPFDVSYKVLMIGDSGVGKTALIKSLMGRSFSPNHNTTIGIDFVKRVFEVDGARVQLEIWDTAGQERFRTITRFQYRGTKTSLGQCQIQKYEWISENKLVLRPVTVKELNDAGFLLICPAQVKLDKNEVQLVDLTQGAGPVSPSPATKSQSQQDARPPYHTTPVQILMAAGPLSPAATTSQSHQDAGPPSPMTQVQILTSAGPVSPSPATTSQPQQDARSPSPNTGAGARLTICTVPYDPDGCGSRLTCGTVWSGTIQCGTIQSGNIRACIIRDQCF